MSDGVGSPAPGRRWPPGSRASRLNTGKYRASAGLADQFVYSASNFGLTVLVARSATPDEFGSFSLLFAGYLIAICVLRGLTSETQIVRYSAVTQERWRMGATAGAGASVAFGTIFGLLIATGGVIAGGTAHSLGIALGGLLPFLALQDNLRYAALASGRPSAALFNDIIQGLGQFALAAILLMRGAASPTTLVLCWGIGACLGAAVGSYSLGVRPRLRSTRSWLREHGDLAYRYAADALASQGSYQAVAYVVTATAGLVAAGALRGAQTVFGPPASLIQGVQSAIVPELVRTHSHSPPRMRSQAYLVGAGLSLVGLVWSVAILLLPDRVGTEILGPTWHHVEPLLIYFAIAQVAAGLRIGPTVGLRALGNARRTLSARVHSTVLGLLLAVIGAVWAGALGVAIATAISAPLQAAIWWRHFQLAATEDSSRSL